MTVGVERPLPATLLDLERALVGAEQQPLVHLAATVAVGEGDRLRAVPLDRDHRHRPDRIEPRNETPATRSSSVPRSCCPAAFTTHRG